VPADKHGKRGFVALCAILIEQLVVGRIVDRRGELGIAIANFWADIHDTVILVSAHRGLFLCRGFRGITGPDSGLSTNH
jgi:hypothetical protein